MAKRAKDKKTGLTENEKKLADLTLVGVSGQAAALTVYDTTSPASARSIASETLARPHVREYLESVAGEAAEIVMGHARNKRAGMVSLVAAKDVLDRAGFKTAEPVRDPDQGATYNFIFSPKTQEEVRRIEAIIRERLTGNHAEKTSEDVATIEEGPE